MTVADVKKIYEPDLARICDTLQLSREFAVIAMRKFNWCAATSDYRSVRASCCDRNRAGRLAWACRDVHRFMDSWYEDPDKLRASIGMPVTEQIASTPYRKVRCTTAVLHGKRWSHA